MAGPSLFNRPSASASVSRIHFFLDVCKGYQRKTTVELVPYSVLRHADARIPRSSLQESHPIGQCGADPRTHRSELEEIHGGGIGAGARRNEDTAMDPKQTNLPVG